MANSPLPRIAIVGGGIAGLAAAIRLAEQGLHVEVFEARRTLGGRAASYRDPATGEFIDHCQHVAMACCTNFHDFCQRTGIADAFTRFDTLHFFDSSERCYPLRASRWLPAPLHLGPALWRQGFLTWRERMAISAAMLKLARTTHAPSDATIGAWLRANGQSERAIALFWSVVLVSALGEVVDHAAFAPARKVFVDGFMRHRDGYQVDVPQESLRTLLDERVAEALQQQGVMLHRNAPVEDIKGTAAKINAIRFADGSQQNFDAIIIATTWRRVEALIPAELCCVLAGLSKASTFTGSPISGVHLWFDRPLTTLPHAVLVDRLSQWVFRREVGQQHYYQVVISASRDLRGMQPDEVVAAVYDDLRTIFPAAREAKLLSSKIVTERDAVFSYHPGLDAMRPDQRTAIGNLFVAGDWTQTGWPSTLEGAVRSGYLAAAGVLAHLGRPQHLLVDDLPSSWLARQLFGHAKSLPKRNAEA